MFINYHCSKKLISIKKPYNKRAGSRANLKVELNFEKKIKL